MSLKAFHLFFVLVSTALATYFSVWCFQQSSETGSNGTFTMGMVSLGCSLALAIYLGWVFKKLRPIAFSLILSSLLFSASSPAWACSVCMGNPKSPLVQSANIGIVFLLMVVGGVLAGFGGLFLTWRSRAKKFEALT